METTPELIIFLIVGSIAILAAVMMLISQNAVHSALFLIVNFACVALMFLMLEAAFLAMVQITVYAGAIMVLFMFVIMLLGAERLTPGTEGRFMWLGRATVPLAMIFLLTAGIGILESEISSSDPEPLEPRFSVINTVAGYEGIEVLLNGQPLDEAIGFREQSDLAALPQGDYTIEIVPHGEAAEAAEAPNVVMLALDDPMTEQNVLEQVNSTLSNAPMSATIEQTEPTLSINGGEAITVVVTMLDDGSLGLIPVYQDLSTVRFRTQARVQVVHAVPQVGTIDLVNITQSDRNPIVVSRDIQFGEASQVEIKRDGNTHFAVYEAGLVGAALDADENVRPADLDEIDAFDEVDFESNTSTLFVVAPSLSDVSDNTAVLLHYQLDNIPAFGGPTSIGQILFTRYMLPFQIVAVLLLVAMIGAIVLTRDQVPPPRKRFPRRLANVPGNPIVGESGQD